MESEPSTQYDVSCDSPHNGGVEIKQKLYEGQSLFVYNIYSTVWILWENFMNV